MPEAAAIADAAPVVLLGRGGSGTRLLSDIARALGVFIGNEVSETGDSLEWADAVYAAALQRLAGVADDGDWPERLRAIAAAMLRRGEHRSDDLWGWKLPETLFVLPAVKEAFPRARYVHLTRRPLASAFRRSHLTSRTDNVVGRAVLARAYAAVGRDADRVASDPDWLRNAVTWRLQVELTLNALEEIDPARVLTLRFEDLVAEPAEAQARLQAFLNIPRAAAAAVRLDPERVAPMIGSVTQADCVWRICGPAALRLGYERA